MENFDNYQWLSGINGPDDVKAIPQEFLPELAAEIRKYLAYRVRENGGHLSSNLGVVELTVAIHRVFDSPTDHVIFDVGHQSYVHKLLTGRKERFDTLRMPGGLSGFTKMTESVHDAFGAGHSSTAISAAIGMATADAMDGRENYTVAVVGDGALTGGLAYEGLNNCRHHLRLVIIINENEMSISPNTGGLSRHLSRIRNSRGYISTKKFTSRTLRRMPLLGRPIYAFLRFVKKQLKSLLYKENVFEQLGLRYVGPMDGNNTDALVAALSDAKAYPGSTVLHVKTQKGAGDAEAEANPDLYHGVAPREKEQNAPTFSEHFGSALCHMAKEDDSLVAITAAMSYGTGLEGFRMVHGDRFFDVGIAEGHAVTFAAGLAAGGKHPVVALYSTFLQRAYDNVLHDAALQKLPLILAVDRAGFNVGDGPTHYGVYDVSLLSAIDGACIFAPVTGEGIAASLRAAKERGGLCAIRYPNATEDERIRAAFYPIDAVIGRPRVRVFDAEKEVAATVVTHGRITAEALKAADRLSRQGVGVRVLLCEYLAPYAELAAEVAPLLSDGPVVFYEEEVRSGGFGENLAAALAGDPEFLAKPHAIVAAQSGFAVANAGRSVWQAAGVDSDALVGAVLDLVKKKQ